MIVNAQRNMDHLQAALGYARKGWPVFPVHAVGPDGRCSCGNVACGHPGKHPRTSHGFKDATVDEDEVRRWWTQWPEANIGIATGQVSGLLVVDIDPQHGGDESNLPGQLPDTVQCLTGGGGSHYYLKYPGGEVRSGPSPWPGIDIKANGGYVVAPPSTHRSGRSYAWEMSSDPEDTPAAACPEWLRQALAGGGESKPIRKADAIPNRIPEGVRNNTLASLAGTLRRRGCTQEEIQAAIQATNQRRCDPPLPEPEVDRIARSISRYEPGNSTTWNERGITKANLTDAGNAQRLVLRHQADIRYCHRQKSWYVWRGTRWERDTSGEIERRAKETVQSMLADAAAVKDPDERQALAKFSLKSEGVARIKAMIELAQSEPGIHIDLDDFDADPWLFNCQNGTIDLRIGQLRPHRREDLLTRISPVEYQPDAKLAIWDEYLETATGGDKQLRAYLQRAIGYVLTGDTSEECLFLPYGPAATGKTTFIEAIKSMMGDYGATADFETFLHRRNVGGCRNDIARLKGTRFVTSCEVDDGRQLAEALIKMLTGQDKIAARFLYQESFEFRPTFKLWLAANRSPAVDSDDDAMWRRIKRIPLDKVIPQEKRDPRVKSRLCDPREGGPAILAWAVQGALDWQFNGLGMPECVRQCTEAYRSDNDTIKMFLEEMCVVGESLYYQSKCMFEAYQRWMDELDEEMILSRRAFSERMKTRGFPPDVQRVGNKTVRVFRGIGPRAVMG